RRRFAPRRRLDGVASPHPNPPRKRGREQGGVAGNPLPRLRARVGVGAENSATIKIAVPLLPRIANFDDLDPLAAEPAGAPELGCGMRLAAAAGSGIAIGTAVRGYEMHLGMPTGPGTARPMLQLSDRPDGAVSADGRVAGCYLHGLFASDPFRRAFLARLGVA